MKKMNFAFQSRRSMVVAKRGMVAASNPLASQAGLHILRQGGNAADAAIAAAAMMNVTAPASTGVGGDCFALYYDAKTGKTTALNGSGRAPAALSIDLLKKQGITGDIPGNSPHAVTVPGAVMGWYDLLKQQGTMTLADVLQDAIYYTENGFGVSPVFGNSWSNSQAYLKNGHSTEDYLPGGSAPCIGQDVRLPGLAKTFRAIAEGGPEAFYTGPIAEAIVNTLQQVGGVMVLDDLKNHTSTWGEPIATEYRGVTVLEHPPNGQGITALIAMNIAKAYDLGRMAWDSPERLHLMVEAMRLAFADAHQYIADVDKRHVPVEGLLDEGYAAQRRKLISPDKAMEPPSYGMPPHKGSDTIYLCVVDGEGNGCSFINSLSGGWGTGIVAQGTGVFLQNRGSNFELDPQHPNALAGGKRSYHTIIPGLATKDGQLWCTFGVMGGFNQPQGHFQVISSMLDDDLNPQDALNRPRWRLTDGRPTSMLHMEPGFAHETMAKLAALGHCIRPSSYEESAFFGCGQIIRRDTETGMLFGGADPRKDSLIAAY